MNNTREILLAWLLIGVLSLMAYGSGDKLVVLSGEQSVRRVVPDIDGGIWVLKSRSPLVLKYSSSGSIVGGFDVSAVPEPLLSPVERRTVYDISTDPEGRLLSLVGVIDWKGRGPSGMLETVLSTSDGAIVTRGDYSGRIVALTGREVLSSIRGMIEGQVSLLSQALE